MYIIDFAKNLFKKSNIGTIIWMVANTLLITLMFGFVINDSGSDISWKGCLIGFGIYMLSIVLALSPVGEWIISIAG